MRQYSPRLVYMRVAEVVSVLADSVISAKNSELSHCPTVISTGELRQAQHAGVRNGETLCWSVQLGTLPASIKGTI